MRAFNQYSFLWTAAVILVAVLSLTRERTRVVAAVVVVLVFTGIFLLLRPVEPGQSVNADLSAIGGGRAVLLELFSPY
jgi:drug/metabolite transporter (DMT)-like permease